MVGLGPEQVRQPREHASHTIVVIQGHRQSLGVPIRGQSAIEVSGGVQAARQLEVQVKGLFASRAVLGQPPQGGQGLLVIGRRVGVGDARDGRGRAREEGHRPVPDLAVHGVMGQPLDVLTQSVGIYAFDNVDNLGVKLAPSS